MQIKDISEKHKLIREVECEIDNLIMPGTNSANEQIRSLCVKYLHKMFDIGYKEGIKDGRCNTI